jgi:hypothetical protein
MHHLRYPMDMCMYDTAVYISAQSFSCEYPYTQRSSGSMLLHCILLFAYACRKLFDPKQARADASLTMTVLIFHDKLYQYLANPQPLIRHQIAASNQLSVSIFLLINHAAH